MWKLRIWQDLKVILKLLFCTVQFMDLIFSYICEQQVSLCVYQSSTGFRFGFISCLGSVENVQSVPVPIKQRANKSNTVASLSVKQSASKLKQFILTLKFITYQKISVIPSAVYEIFEFQNWHFSSVDFRRFLKGSVSRDFRPPFFS